MRAWTACAAAALALGGLAAPLLALSRVPAVAGWPLWPVQAFEKGLVLHVVFSFVLWPLAVFCAAVLTAAGESGAQPGGRRAAAGCFAASFALLALPAFTAAGASLNDYVPVILHPVFFAGLTAAFLGAGLLCFSAVRFSRRPQTPEAGAFVLLSAGACFFLSAPALKGGADPAAFQEFFWAGGHVLQFLNVIILIFGWRALAGLALGREAVPPRVWSAALALCAAGAAAGPLFFAFYEPFSGAHLNAYTLWQYALAPAPAAAGACVLAAFWRARRAAEPCRNPLARAAVLLSVATFALGGFLGLFVDGADARTPAHYHGVIGGLNLAAYGLVFCVFLPAAGRAVIPGRRVFAVFWLYASGQMIHAASLFVAGGYGAPRKTAADAGGPEALGAQIGLYGIGAGGLLAAAGGVLFVVLTGRALLRRAPGAPAA